MAPLPGSITCGRYNFPSLRMSCTKRLMVETLTKKASAASRARELFCNFLHLFASFCMMQKMPLRQAIRYPHGIHEAAIHVPHRTCHLPELTRCPILLTRYLIRYASISKIKNYLSELTRYPILLTRAL